MSTDDDIGPLGQLVFVGIEADETDARWARFVTDDGAHLILDQEGVRHRRQVLARLGHDVAEEERALRLLR